LLYALGLYDRHGGAIRDEPPDVLSAEEIKQLRDRIAHLSPEGVRQLYDSTIARSKIAG
jgi:hypothetical protein